MVKTFSYIHTMSFDIKEHFFTVKEISDLLKLSELTIYKYIRSRELEAAEFGGHFRVSESSLGEFIAKHMIKKEGVSET